MSFQATWRTIHITMHAILGDEMRSEVAVKCVLAGAGHSNEGWAVMLDVLLVVSRGPSDTEGFEEDVLKLFRCREDGTVAVRKRITQILCDFIKGIAKA